MNIFVSNSCPVKSAQFLDTLRCNKMILESAQMLSTALRQHGADDSILYKTTHLNHPMSIWCRENKSNYTWLLEHMEALAKEYYRRRGKWHLSYTKLFTILKRGAQYLPDGQLTPFPNCAANKSKGVCFKHIPDVHEAYRLYLNERWKNDVRTPVWT